MYTPASVGADQVPPYEVGCLDIEAASGASGHRHVTLVETRDPDGGSTRWSCAQVIAAIEDGERFVVAADGRGALTLLEPGRCPACAAATLVTDPADAAPGPCEQAISKFLRGQPDSTSGDGADAAGPACPRCSAPMVMLTAPSGEHAGRPIWSCSTYPNCRGISAVAPDRASVPGRTRVARLPRGWPAAVAFTLGSMLAAYLLTQAYFGAGWGSVAASTVALGLAGSYVRGSLRRQRSD